VKCLADVEIAIDCELRRCSTFDVASCADNFIANGERGTALLYICFTCGKLDVDNSKAEERTPWTYKLNKVTPSQLLFKEVLFLNTVFRLVAAEESERRRAYNVSSDDVPAALRT
jgi:hypothetical protein